jgi:poly(ADP-ribose) glycohydrolase ARH3
MPGSLADALTGCLLGQALGDALGFVVEAATPEIASEYVEWCLRSGQPSSRSHPDFPFGQYSDDTQLARELLCTIRSTGRWDPAEFGRRIGAIFANGRIVGSGPGTRFAAEQLLAGVRWQEAGRPAPYAGNGSAMRAAPLGVLFRDDPEMMQRVVVEQSSITHQDRRCAAGAVVVAGAAALASTREAIRPEDFLGQLAAWAAPLEQSVADTVRAVAGWLPLTATEAARRLHESGLDSAASDQWRGISSFVLPSVAWSLYAFLRSPDDYWATVCTAIGVGGDTDTMAAIAGGIGGARGGVSALPRQLVASLNDRGEWRATELIDLACDCARMVTASPSPPPS